MKTKEFLKEHDACKDGAKWALSISGDMADVWDALIKQGKHDWLVWTATRPGMFSDYVLHKLASRFIRETPLSDGRTVWDLLTDERSRKAVEVAELYADGKSTYEELQAACAAAYNAADATAYATSYAAYAASYAADAAAYAADAASYAADAAAYAADAAADAAAEAAAFAAYAASDAAAYAAAYAAAKAAQAQMIAEMGNPFKERAKEKDWR